MEKFNGRMCPVSIDDAETAFDYQPEVSGSSSFVYGVEQFKESLKESVPQAGGVVGGLLHKAGKEIDKYFPDGIKLFNGSVDIKIADKLKKGGEILVNAADRNVEAMKRKFRRNNPRLEKAQENIMFDVGNQGANWTTMLLTGKYAGYVMGNLVLGGEFQERADKYKQEHGGSLEGFAQEYGDEAGYNLANAFVQGVEERYLGSFAQVKSIKKGMGFVKAIGKNAVQEGFIEEPLQDVTDFYFDKLTGFNENEELKDRLKGNLRGYVVASLFGGAGGFGAAVYQRAEGIDYYKEALKNTVPEKDLEKVATKAYEQDAKTLREIVTVEIENSSSLENKRGEVYENMYKSAIDSINRARKQGGYYDLRTEEEVSAYAKAEADNFANWVLEEANRRNTTIQNVLDASSIYSDETGLHIGMTKVVEQVEKVETFEPVAERKTELAYEDIIHQLNTREMSEEEEERLQDMLDEERDRLKPLFDTALDAEIEIEEEFDLVSELTDLSDSMTENKMSYEEAKRKLPDLPEEQFEKLGDKIKEKEGIQGDSAKIGYEYFTDRVFDKYNERIARSRNYRLLQESLELAQEMERLDDLYPTYEGETITINGQEKTVYNSNGDRIAQSAEALNNFYKWFGDSKVVDKQGRPLVVYHGTNKEFEVFSKGLLGKTTQAESAKKGFFFTDDTEVADSYADYAAIYQPINELLEKQRQAEKEGNWDLFDKLTIEIEEKDREISQTPANQRGKKVYAVYLKANNVMEYDAKDEYFSDIGEDINKVLDKARKDKKDGVIIKNLKDQPNVYDEKSANHFVVFESNQIKSTSNRGTYSESENIYYQDDIRPDYNKIYESEEYKKISDTAKKVADKLGLSVKTVSINRNGGISAYINTPYGDIRISDHDTNYFVGILNSLSQDVDKIVNEYKEIESIRKTKEDKQKYFNDIVAQIKNKYTNKQIKEISQNDVLATIINKPYSGYLSSTKFYGKDAEIIEKWRNSDVSILYPFMENLDDIYYQSAFAGSRVDYDRPSLEAIGSGEGAQAHGWGLYYALSKDVAERYREKFVITNDNTTPEGLATQSYYVFDKNKSEAIKSLEEYYNTYKKDLYKKALELLKSDDFKPLHGQVHEVDIPENPYLLDEQKTFAEQSEFVKEQLNKVFDNIDVKPNELVKLTGSASNPYKNVAKYKTGREIYKDLSTILKSDKAASQLLEKYGIKGITYDGRQDGRCFVIFNPEDVRVIQKFYQRGKSTRGSIQFKGQEAIIRLTESANASTLAHELAHYYLQNTFLYSKSGLASPEYSTYFKPIADYLGIDSNQETIKDWQQEKFARAYEQYLLKGKAETPELQAAFNNYNKWIKRAYRMLKSKPKYRNEEGKLVEPRLTPEIMEAFGKLTGGFVARPDIEAMAETVTPELENAVVEYENQVTQEQERIQKETVYPTTEIRETAEEGTTGKSGVAFRVLGEELGYDVKHIEDQMDKAREFVRKNLSEAKEIINGKQAPEGMLSSAINLAYVEIMENSGNYQEAERATRIRSMEQTRRGQEIAMEKATTDNILNAETWSNLVLSRKSAEAARKYFKNDLKALQDFIKKESANIAKQIVNKPKEERAAIIKENLERITQETGILFQEDYSDLEDSDYYNEVLNETQLMIEKSMGIGLDEDQIDYIHDNVRQLQDIVKETVSNNGNISIEAFKQIRKMYDTIESYTPSSNVAVWSSIIGRGAMLASIKSPVLNIISNAENMITETLSRKALNIVTGQSNDNIVDSNIINDYLKWSYNVYQASGYMPSVTSDILGGRPILGEKRLTSQGQGKVRAIGRFAEDIVFKELMGLPDSISKDLNFVSVAGNKATQQAYKEGLSGDKAKARANELFKDAILLRPMTEEGERIRNESMKAAHEATFTQDSEISNIALRIRDVLNSKEFKAGDFLVPFVKTPANVVALGMEYSLGSIYTVYHIKDIINNPQSDISQAAIKAGVRNGIGMILAMMLAGLVDDDDYIPEYDNASPKQRDIAKLKNAPFNSIRIGNKWINLDYFGPLAIPMAGILTARAKQDLTGFLQGVSGQALKTPGVKEINSLIGDVTRAVQYGVSYKKIAEDVFNWGVEQTASRTIPAIFTDFGKLIDKYERETGGEMVRRVMAKIPVLREELPIKTDITGRKIETETTNILFGSRVKTAVDDAVVKEIDRLNKAGNAPTISDPTRYGKFRSLETEEKDKIRTKFNQEYGRKAREKIASSAYKRLDDAQKKKELNKIRKKISDDLKKQK